MTLLNQKKKHADKSLKMSLIRLKSPNMKIVAFESSIDPVHYEPPLLDLGCLPSGFSLLNMMIIAWTKYFSKFCRCKFCRLLFGAFKG